jgi:hypothetical protein
MSKELTRKDLEHAKDFGVGHLSQNERAALFQYALDHFQEAVVVVPARSKAR